MFLNLNIETLSMTSGWADKDSGFARVPAVTMDLSMIGRHHLDLATGEVLRGSWYNSDKDKKPSVKASARVSVANDTMPKSAMRYFEASRSSDGIGDSEASIYFEVLIDAEAFAHLIANIRGGVFPTDVQFQLEFSSLNKNSAIKFGWEPDGSGMKWDNSTTDKRTVPLVTASFNYAILKKKGDDDFEDDAKPKPVFGYDEADRKNAKALLATVQEINVNLSRLIKVLVVATALGVSYRFW